MTRDRVTGLISLVLGIAVAVLTSQLPPSNVANDLGPQAFPYITSGILILCGIAIVLKKPVESKPFFKNGMVSIKRFALLWVVLIVYVAGMAFLGFIIPSIAVLFVMCMMFGKDPEHGVDIAPWKAAVFAVVMTAAVYVLFSIVLQLRLPVGQFGVKIGNISLL